MTPEDGGTGPDTGGASDPPDGIVEHVPAPPPEPVIHADRPTHADKTRKWIAYGLVWLLALLAVLGAAGWLGCGDTQQMQSYAVVFSPVVTLVGTVLGFYFSSSKTSR